MLNPFELWEMIKCIIYYPFMESGAFDKDENKEL
jgi:hypothetical protein